MDEKSTSTLDALRVAEQDAHTLLVAADVELYNAVDDWTTERGRDRDAADERLLTAHKAYSTAWDVWASANREYQDEKRRLREAKAREEMS